MNTPTNPMKPEMLQLLKDLADVLEKHAGGLTYTTSDDGVHVTQGEEWGIGVCIEWPSNGNVSKLREIIQANATSEGSPPSRIETKQERNGDSLH